MADFYMHVLLVEDIEKVVPFKLNLGLAKMGAQGPDPFYFNALNIFKKESMRLADAMHQKRINRMLIEMTNFVKNYYSDDLYSFYVGFLSHYALDTIIHPYVYYYTGDYKKDKIKTITHRGLHVKFERRIDIHFIKSIKGEVASSYPVCDICFNYLEVPDEIKEMIGVVSRVVYKEKNAANLYQSGYKSMNKICRRYVMDRYGFKQKILSFFDLFNKKEQIHFRDLSYYNYDEDFDYLNENRTTWHHPVTNEAFNDSVKDLYLKAFIRAFELINQTRAYILENKEVDLEKLFKNLSLNSGIDVDIKHKMRYFNLFIKK
jgi:hypothetical protein